MLESVGKRPNIHRLILEEPRRIPKLHFDPERDLSSDDWEKMQEAVFDANVTDNLYDLICFYILSPDRSQRLNIPPQIWNTIAEKIDPASAENAAEEDPYDFTQALLLTKLALPKRFREIYPDPKNLEQDYLYLEERILSNTGSLGMIAKDLAGLEILMLGRISQNEEAKHKLIRQIERSYLLLLNDWFERSLYCENVANFRLVYPQAYQELYAANIPWKAVLGDLNKDRSEGYYFSMLSLARDMKILAAKEVLVTDKGLELVMPGKELKFNTSTVPLPAVRRF